MIDSYDKMPIGMYFKLQALVLNEPDDLEWKPKALAILQNTTEEAVLNAPLSEFSANMQKAAFLVKAPELSRVKTLYKAGELELVPTLDTQKVTTAQYIDFQTFCKMKDDHDRCVHVLSCLMIPRGCKYMDGYDPAAVRRAIDEHVTVVDALSLYGFFFEKLHASIRRTRTYSEKMIARMRKLATTPEREKLVTTAEARLKQLQKMEGSMKNGAGLLMLTPFQRLAAVLGMRFGV